MRYRIEHRGRIKYFTRQPSLKLSISAAERDVQETKRRTGFCAPWFALTNVVANLMPGETERCITDGETRRTVIKRGSRGMNFWQRPDRGRCSARVAQRIEKFVTCHNCLAVGWHWRRILAARRKACKRVSGKAQRNPILFTARPCQFPAVAFHRGGLMQADNNTSASKTRFGNTWSCITYRNLHV